MMLMILVPGITAFILTSLRQASAYVISEKESIRIVIRKLVKMYDRDNRFVREWKSGIKIRERAGLLKDYKKLRDFYDLGVANSAYLFSLFISHSFILKVISGCGFMSHVIYLLSFSFICAI